MATVAQGSTASAPTTTEQAQPARRGLWHWLKAKLSPEGVADTYSEGGVSGVEGSVRGGPFGGGTRDSNGQLG